MVEGASGALQSSWLLGSVCTESPSMEMLKPLSPLIQVFDHPPHSKKVLSISRWNYQSSGLYSSCHPSTVHCWVKSGCIFTVLSHEAATGRKKIPPRFLWKGCMKLVLSSFSTCAMCSRPPDHQSGLAPRVKGSGKALISFTIWTVFEHSIWKPDIPNKFSLQRKTKSCSNNHYNCICNWRGLREVPTTSIQ